MSTVPGEGHLKQSGTNVGILPRGKLFSSFQDGDAAAESAIGPSELQTDIDAAKHDKVLGQTGQRLNQGNARAGWTPFGSARLQARYRYKGVVRLRAGGEQ